tara:strand:- start:80 stop:241 length:162 start_codon:yes stop_codon:yes gene_type:complete
MNKDLPNPGSDEAREDGCICPVLDNEYGSHEITGGHFITSINCPLHGWSLEDE